MTDLAWIFIFSTFNLCFIDHAVFAQNSDERVDIVRPCPNGSIGCIRQVLGPLLQCGNIQEPYHLDFLPLPLSSSNNTYIWSNVDFSGFKNYKINEFYINRATNNLVLEVELIKIIATSPKSYYIFYRKGKEYIVTADYFNVIYNNLSLTLTVPYDRRYKVTDGQVYAYMNDANPPIKKGPALAPKDPEALRAFLAVTEQMPITLREVFVVQASLFLNLFLQIVACK